MSGDGPAEQGSLHGWKYRIKNAIRPILTLGKRNLQEIADGGGW